jgi:hypothetical protein
MGKRLSVKRAKRTRDKARAYKEGTTPSRHKVAVERSQKDKLRKAFRAY